MTHTLTKADLSQFIGSEAVYRSAVPEIVYTEGVKYVCEAGGAYWLIDKIAINQRQAAIAAEPYQIWTLTVFEDQSAVLTCDDGSGDNVFLEDIGFTDFPLDEIQIFYMGNVIMLPSEY